MKALLALIFLLSFNSPASADDNISVTVNGHTYTCGEGGGGSFRFYCKCSLNYHWSDGRFEYHLDYLKADRNSGQETLVKEIAQFQDKNEDKVKADCHQAFQDNGLCSGH